MSTPAENLSRMVELYNSIQETERQLAILKSEYRNLYIRTPLGCGAYIVDGHVAVVDCEDLTVWPLLSAESE